MSEKSLFLLEILFYDSNIEVEKQLKELYCETTR